VDIGYAPRLPRLPSHFSVLIGQPARAQVLIRLEDARGRPCCWVTEPTCGSRFVSVMMVIKLDVSRWEQRMELWRRMYIAV
jgi:hypothetical protein